MTPVEKVARAWCREIDTWNLRRKLDKDGYEAVRYEPDKPISEETQRLVDLGPNYDAAVGTFQKIQRVEAARAAISALEEPSEAMVGHGGVAMNAVLIEAMANPKTSEAAMLQMAAPYYVESPRAMFRAMIRAALDEK